MISATDLAEAYARNVRLVHKECEGISNADSLIQPQPRGNCLNWVVGHMLTGRNNVLAALNAPFTVPEDALVPYQRESEPLLAESDGVLPLEQLLAWLAEGQTHINTLLPTITEVDFTKEVFFGLTGRMIPFTRLAFFLYFHDTYHVGQTNYLRQVAGKDDKTL